LAIILIPLFWLLAACAVAPEEPQKAERPRSAQLSDEGLEWECHTFPPEVRDFCFQFMAQKRPTAALVDRVEARLASHPCIDSLARWQRLYSFASVRGDPRSVDEDRIAFQFREAGFEEFRSERRVTAPEVWVQVDDRPYNFVSGYFDLRSGELTVDFCGPNIGPS
jgi:hypothetical protein